jgi:hypothetical protein
MAKATAPVNLTPRRQGTHALGRVLPAILPKPTGEAAVLAQLLGHWSALCPGLAAYAYPAKLARGVLTICVASPSVGQEVQYMAPQLVHGAALLLGYGAVSSIRTTSSGWRGAALLRKPQALSQAEVAAARAKCKNVADDELQTSLARLGAWAARTPQT